MYDSYMSSKLTFRQFPPKLQCCEKSRGSLGLLFESYFGFLGGGTMHSFVIKI